ncbi:MAG: hypothetical protein IPP91_09015 [Betaproteobacteria bacterium]|nr:hypothetical protein [Betaproteobacteria bacterium]
MGRNRSRRDDNLRRHLAYLAARLMAEEGVQDYGYAKQKAARQAGLADSHALPDNREIEAALREYQGLFQSDNQPAELRHLREVAVEVMRDFADFRPILVGAVLNGTANQFSEVTLQLFADDSKSLALFLVNRRYRFEQDEKRVRVGDDWVDVPQFFLEVDGAPVTLAVYARGDEHLAPRSRPDSDGLQRARLAQVEALLEP